MTNPYLIVHLSQLLPYCPVDYVEPAEKAIRAAERGQWQERIPLPYGDGEIRYMTVARMVKRLRLQRFLE